MRNRIGRKRKLRTWVKVAIVGACIMVSSVGVNSIIHNEDAQAQSTVDEKEKYFMNDLLISEQENINGKYKMYLREKNGDYTFTDGDYTVTAYQDVINKYELEVLEKGDYVDVYFGENREVIAVDTNVYRDEVMKEKTLKFRFEGNSDVADGQFWSDEDGNSYYVDMLSAENWDVDNMVVGEFATAYLDGWELLSIKK